MPEKMLRPAVFIEGRRERLLVRVEFDFGGEQPNSASGPRGDM